MAMKERTVSFECFWKGGGSDSVRVANQEGFSEEMVFEPPSRIMGVILSGCVRDKRGQECLGRGSSPLSSGRTGYGARSRAAWPAGRALGGRTGLTSNLVTPDGQLEVQGVETLSCERPALWLAIPHSLGSCISLLGLPHGVPQTGWVKQPQFVFSPFWRLEV